MSIITMTLLANTKGLTNGITQANGKLATLGGAAKKAAGIASVGFGLAGAAALKLGKDAIESASNAQQSLGATETVFGRYAKSVIDNSNRASTALGISANEYRELSNVTGALLAGAGMPLKKVAGLTDDLNKRAADMAATFGGTTKDAVEAISSLMKGEADPIEKYGVSIKQSDINAQLAAKGLDGLTGSARKQAEMQERLTLLMGKTAKVEGAFHRETNTLAHQQQVLAAQFEDTKAKIGAVLLPALTRMFGFITAKVMPSLGDWYKMMKTRLAPVFDTISTQAKRLGDALSPVGDWLREHPELIKGAGIALGIAAAAAGALAIAMGAVAIATSPITLTVLAIAGLGAGIAYAYKNSSAFRSGVQKLGAAFKQFASAALPVAKDVLDALKRLWTEAEPKIRAALNSIKSVFIDAMSIVSSVVTGAVKAVQFVWQTFGANIVQYVTSALNNIITALQGAFQVIQGIFQVVSGLLRGDWSKAWTGIKNIVRGALRVIGAVIRQALNVIRFAIKNAWAAVKALTSLAWSGIKTALSKAWDGIKTTMSKAWDSLRTTARTKLSTLVTLVKGIPGRLKNALLDADTWLKTAGENVVRGMWAGIQSMGGWLTDKVWDWVKSVLPGPVEKALGINSPSRVFKEIGKYTVAGLAQGIDDTGENRRLSAAAARMTDNLRISPVASRNAVSGPSRSTAAPVVVQQTFQVPPNFDKREFGRLIAESLAAYQGVGGVRVA